MEGRKNRQRCGGGGLGGLKISHSYSKFGRKAELRVEVELGGWGDGFSLGFMKKAEGPADSHLPPSAPPRLTRESSPPPPSDLAEPSKGHMQSARLSNETGRNAHQRRPRTQSRQPGGEGALSTAVHEGKEVEET